MHNLSLLFLVHRAFVRRRLVPQFVSQTMVGSLLSHLSLLPIPVCRDCQCCRRPDGTVSDAMPSNHLPLHHILNFVKYVVVIVLLKIWNHYLQPYGDKLVCALVSHHFVIVIVHRNEWITEVMMSICRLINGCGTYCVNSSLIFTKGSIPFPVTWRKRRFTPFIWNAHLFPVVKPGVSLTSILGFCHNSWKRTRTAHLIQRPMLLRKYAYLCCCTCNCKMSAVKVAQLNFPVKFSAHLSRRRGALEFLYYLIRPVLVI